MRLSKRGRLRLRRQQAGPIVREIQESYRLHTVSSAPLSTESGLDDCTVIAASDRYGFPIRLALSNQTGVIFLVDRLNRTEYDRFYASGDYRRLVNAYKGRLTSDEATLVSLEQRAEDSTAETIRALEGLVSFPANGRLLDIGGASGQLAMALRDRFGLHPTVLDPSERELRAAAHHGLDTRLGQFETMQFPASESYDVVVLHQTVEHITDLQLTMGKIRQLLPAGGVLLFDFLDFLDQLAIYGCAEAVSRLDHCHWLYYEMLGTFLNLTGFQQLVTIRSRPSVFLVACQATAVDPKARIGDEMRMKVVREVARRQVDFANMPLFDALSPAERIKRRLGMRVGPF